MTDIKQILKDRDYWRDECRKAWQEIEKHETTNEQLAKLNESYLEEMDEVKSKRAVTLFRYAEAEREIRHLKHTLEFFQLKALNLIRRENGEPEYLTTRDAVDTIKKSGGVPKLFGHDILTSNHLHVHYEDFAVSTAPDRKTIDIDVQEGIRNGEISLELVDEYEDENGHHTVTKWSNGTASEIVQPAEGTHARRAYPPRRAKRRKGRK